MITKKKSNHRRLDSMACRLSPELHLGKVIYLKSVFLVNRVMTCGFNWLVCFSQLSATTGNCITKITSCYLRVVKRA